MIDELRRRNDADRTTTAYINAVAAFALFFNRSPDRIRSVKCVGT
jgi:hypothetical protein